MGGLALELSGGDSAPGSGDSSWEVPSEDPGEACRSEAALLVKGPEQGRDTVGLGLNGGPDTGP